MNWSLYHAKLHQVLKDRRLLPRDSKILIAISGGQDSLCLGKLALDLQRKWSWNLAIAHCDHRWSWDEGLADHVQKIAHNWGLPFYLEIADLNLPETEAAARKWRYQALTKIAATKGFSHVLTGHSMSDRAETLLYNLVRGAGSEGLSALNWQRNLTETIQLVRPLLNFSREETFAFCQKFNLPIWPDVYNTKKKYARNRIRLDLIPYLKQEFNPQVETKLAQTAELLKAEGEYLEYTSQQIFKQVIRSNQKALDRFQLSSYPLALQRRVIRHFLVINLQISPNFEQIESVIKLISSPNKTRTSTLFKKAIAQVQDSLIILIKA